MISALLPQLFYLDFGVLNWMGKLKYLTEVKTKDILRDYDSFHKDKQQRKDFFFFSFIYIWLFLKL